jgi:hypothetical protein
MNDEIARRLTEIITEIRQAGRPQSGIQSDFAAMRAYQVGFTHGVEAVLEVLAYAGLIDDTNYLLDLDVHDDDHAARLLISSWQEITRELAGEEVIP